MAHHLSDQITALLDAALIYALLSWLAMPGYGPAAAAILTYVALLLLFVHHRAQLRLWQPTALESADLDLPELIRPDVIRAA
ncbi:hypothetical protein KEM60_00454 [Austwickia sp. TVS 96-490-7B]|uniref:hypothetical protein n=1 Tax=Austwickia sp. TVS 96-490-7B TaxID=2830843 RepID=UPI001C57C9E3|nr:hypothetical protein [Austwickia sp. TVS 96-490-7B]MBW3084267.1 hypothetical protein [Austwickia sp. TVS 96-490-7B]